jgi:hypothetical protein
VDDVNIHIEELAMEHPADGHDPRDMDVRLLPPADQLSIPVAAEIRRAVSAALSSGSVLEV